MSSIKLKQKLLQTSKLYLILDTQVLDYSSLFRLVKDLVPSGIDVVQLRDKTGNARDTLHWANIFQSYLNDRIPFIINDRIDIAMLAQATGVHLGQDDISYSEARRLMGPKAVIGVSCQSLAQVEAACRSGVDYIGFGSVFKTKTKPERDPMDLRVLDQVSRVVNVPLFAIGGINHSNVSKLVSLGVKRIAVCRDILCAEQPKEVIDLFRNQLPND